MGLLKIGLEFEYLQVEIEGRSVIRQRATIVWSPLCLSSQLDDLEHKKESRPIKLRKYS